MFLLYRKYLNSEMKFYPRKMINRFYICLLFSSYRIVPTIGDLQHSSPTSSIIHCIQFHVSFWSLINVQGVVGLLSVEVLDLFIAETMYDSYQLTNIFLFVAFGDKQIFGGLAGFIVSFLNLNLSIILAIVLT